MKKFGALEQLSDFSDFGRYQQLREALQGRPGLLRQLRASPDGRHLLLLLAAERRLLSFDRLPRAAACCLERSWPSQHPHVAEILFVDAGGAESGAARPGDAPWVLVIAWENGRAEVWRYRQAGGWGQLQTLELCSSARARVASVCSHAGGVVWCEERPPAEGSGRASALFSYCICRRGLALQGRDVTLGPVNIVLHHSPQYRLLSSHRDVFFVPAASALGELSKLLLVWSPRAGKITVVSPSRGFIHSTSLALGESDFKKLLIECAGLLPSIETVEIHSLALSYCGDLLLLRKQGDIDLLQRNGAVRHVYSFSGLPLTSDEEVQMQIYGNTFASVLDRSLYLVDVSTGRLMEKKILNAEEMIFMKPSKDGNIQFLTKTGIYAIHFSNDGIGKGDNCRSEPALVEMVFEEACKYYQRRSLSNTKLTVETLKNGGMFQAPIALASILQSYKKENLHQSYTNLLSTLSSELQSYLSLELLKSHIIDASESSSQQYCEDLVDLEMSRLLNSDLDKENLAYINTVFNAFPKAAWKAIKRNLQLQWNGDGKLVARAVPDVWKKILGPSSLLQEANLNGALPLFELICQSLYKFKPAWLPSFVAELTQQQVSFSWNYGCKESSESVPLYKRALSVLTKRHDNTTHNDADIEIELLLCSERPKAIMQAVTILIHSRQWERVVEAALTYSKLSPVVNKDIFTTLLAQFAQHRELDSYLGKLWEICPRDMTATDILNIVLQHIPKSEEDQTPFPNSENQLTIGLLKPLLSRVLQYHSKSDIYVDVVQTPTFPPPTPPR
uniref:Hermansky-Pudlak syndrome 6 protein n=1 Tax=Geotrypetes seraphini TaxID=260995 RepID=A0A6P8R939_GEOSA|nr:Hermansky-Pudlak syndrome 6 protein [Geotrypetes seraphini]